MISYNKPTQGVLYFSNRKEYGQKYGDKLICLVVSDVETKTEGNYISATLIVGNSSKMICYANRLSFNYNEFLAILDKGYVLEAFKLIHRYCTELELKMALI
jgi:hypothetical protein